ncbi:MAG: ribbon-helix-helix protein, CopG family [Acidobacteria bacterium]|nr:ribbon-helix-helix protein, CopG family [Acidobacteriota bacterium]
MDRGLRHPPRPDSHHEQREALRVDLTLDADLLDRVDGLVARQRFRNRSQAIETALAEKLARLVRTRLAEECAKLDPDAEQRLADEGLLEIVG